MDLKTTYLGLELKNPIVVGACPLGTSVDSIRHSRSPAPPPSCCRRSSRRRSWPPSQRNGDGIGRRRFRRGRVLPAQPRWLPRRPGPVPRPPRRRPRTRCRFRSSARSTAPPRAAGPTTPRRWRKPAPTPSNSTPISSPFDAEETGAEVEQRTIDIVAAVKEAVSIPVSVKLSPFFSSLPNLAKQLEEVGADGLVIFNRFYQPDIDIEELDVIPNLRLSTADELRLRLRWLAILSGQVEHVAGSHRRRPQRRRRHQGRHERRPLGADGLGPAHPRARPHRPHPRGHRLLAHRARVRVARADAGLPEPGQGPDAAKPSPGRTT